MVVWEDVDRLLGEKGPPGLHARVSSLVLSQ